MLEYHYENISYFAGGGTSNQLKTNQDRTNFSSSRLMRRWMPVSKGIDGDSASFLFPLSSGSLCFGPENFDPKRHAR
jgi:hypothetical protein